MIKPKAPYFAFVTGYGMDDVLDYGESGDGVHCRTDQLHADLIWLHSYNDHPGVRDLHQHNYVRKMRRSIDQSAEVHISTMHANKRIEAERVKFDGITDPERLPFLSAELANQPDKTIQELAEEIWKQVCNDAEPEATRTHDKRMLDA